MSAAQQMALASAAASSTGIAWLSLRLMVTRSTSSAERRKMPSFVRPSPLSSWSHSARSTSGTPSTSEASASGRPKRFISCLMKPNTSPLPPLPPPPIPTTRPLGGGAPGGGTGGPGGRSAGGGGPGGGPGDCKLGCRGGTQFAGEAGGGGP
eukprot:scaffold69962_cov39-Phaeocystis_antarctica.AAC.2